MTAHAGSHSGVCVSACVCVLTDVAGACREKNLNEKMGQIISLCLKIGFVGLLHVYSDTRVRLGTEMFHLSSGNQMHQQLQPQTFMEYIFQTHLIRWFACQ